MDSAEEASAYDAMDHDQVNRAFVDRLVALGARGRMLDIGTGPAHIPLLVADRLADCAVVAVDLSPAMLAIARRRLASSPHRARIELHLADARALDFEDGSFEAVFSNTILHHLADPRPVLREAARLLRPGGVLLIRDLYRPETDAEVERLVATHAASAGPVGRELLRASLRAAFTPDELRALADECGLAAAELVVDTDRHMSLQIAA
ncbi:MAG TPA: class I SAM-dependent methyltransferase [Kofleriaceae bacterium]|nr:class I SAM-dependent methyltransferase [Kofleriaceae bacterium]